MQLEAWQVLGWWSLARGELQGGAETSRYPSSTALSCGRGWQWLCLFAQAKPFRTRRRSHWSLGWRSGLEEGQSWLDETSSRGIQTERDLWSDQAGRGKLWEVVGPLWPHRLLLHANVPSFCLWTRGRTSWKPRSSWIQAFPGCQEDPCTWSATEQGLCQASAGCSLSTPGIKMKVQTNWIQPLHTSALSWIFFSCHLTYLASLCASKGPGSTVRAVCTSNLTPPKFGQEWCKIFFEVFYLECHGHGHKPHQVDEEFAASCY